MGKQGSWRHLVVGDGSVSTGAFLTDMYLHYKIAEFSGHDFGTRCERGEIFRSGGVERVGWRRDGYDAIKGVEISNMCCDVINGAPIKQHSLIIDVGSMVCCGVVYCDAGGTEGSAMWKNWKVKRGVGVVWRKRAFTSLKSYHEQLVQLQAPWTKHQSYQYQNLRGCGVG